MRRKGTTPPHGHRPVTGTEAARQLQRFHRIGRDSLAKQPGRFRPGESRDAAARAALTPHMLSKARRFADPYRGYTPKQLERLLRTCREGPYPITRQHVIRLLSVPRRDRARLEKRVAREGWGAVRLGEEVKRIRREVGEPEGHGRPFRTPSDSDELSTDIVLRAERWRRWYRYLAERATEEGGSPLHELSPALRRELRGIDRKLGKLIEVARQTD